MKVAEIAGVSESIDGVAAGIDKLGAQRDRLRRQLEVARTGLMLIRALTTDEKTRAIAESALEEVELVP